MTLQCHCYVSAQEKLKRAHKEPDTSNPWLSLQEPQRGNNPNVPPSTHNVVTRTPEHHPAVKRSEALTPTPAWAGLEHVVLSGKSQTQKAVHLREISRTGKSTGTESGSVVVRDWGGDKVTADGERFLLG